MFEVLLQADRALASGDLDQAERAYWQLVELDPTNAIAVTGLARISMDRGDRRLARTLAAQALAIDPETVGARKILEAVDSGKDRVADTQPTDLTFLAAQRLEALGRRRAQSEPPAAGNRPTPLPMAEPDSNPFPQLPSEPLSDRRQTGRRVAPSATAAAAEAAARALPPKPRGAHQALGERAHRRLMPEDFKLSLRTNDPFAAAETAATIEAIDAADDFEVTDAPAAASSPAAPTPAPTPAQTPALAPTEPAPAPAPEAETAQAPETGVGRRTGLGRRVMSADEAAFAAAEAESAVLATEAETDDLAEPDVEVVRRRPRVVPRAVPTQDELSQEEAEEAAMKEAMAQVLGGDAGSQGSDFEPDGEPDAHDADAATPRKGFLGRLRRN